MWKKGSADSGRIFSSWIAAGIFLFIVAVLLNTIPEMMCNCRCPVHG
ncbi:hypothetical protein HNQ91_002304 [Filimonas zeae]|nr:hypothetical protein [Filimonas zeae]